MDLPSLVEAIVRRPPLFDATLPAKIPWDEPDFSARMLAEHLDGSPDRASRRASLIDAHVGWLFADVMAGAPGAVLDLGCGPGLYTERLAARGCSCVGIDVSPASVDHARAVAAIGGLDCQYRLADFTEVDLGGGYDAALLLFGELNTFPPQVAAALLRRMAASLVPGGALVLEVHLSAAVRRMGQAPPGWWAAASGLFSDRPHLVLTEHAWREPGMVAATRHLVVDAGTGAVTTYGEQLFAHGDDDVRRMLAGAGLVEVETLPGPLADPDLVHVVARRAASHE